MKKCKISPATLARTAALALALTNQVLSATGHRVLPIESAELDTKSPFAILNTYSRSHPATVV